MTTSLARGFGACMTAVRAAASAPAMVVAACGCRRRCGGTAALRLPSCPSSVPPARACARAGPWPSPRSVGQRDLAPRLLSSAASTFSGSRPSPCWGRWAGRREVDALVLARRPAGDLRGHAHHREHDELALARRAAMCSIICLVEPMKSASRSTSSRALRMRAGPRRRGARAPALDLLRDDALVRGAVAAVEDDVLLRAAARPRSGRGSCPG
jgi:hypothetical protein